ncbi:MAG: excinuclease ABC subunit UvrC [Gulosibacter sp.]|uniref:excinuclease ABC subunit UvrC n=1 Tax=Gulosibacter sp. TaxID=2817531 RepID=UPI003F92530D
MRTYLEWRPKASDIPTSPGVYRWLGENGRLLYVGKAKNLRARLTNYFAPLETLNERTRRMVTSAVDVTWTVVNTEREALQLEYTWIQEYSPPYNVRLKDDKSYPYMVVTLGDESPRVMMTRNRKIKGARYFGPFPKVYAVTEAMNLMLQIFPIRTCNNTNYRRAMQTGKPCFAGQIGKCGGPCSQKVTIAEHRKVVDKFVHFMETYDRSVADQLTREMNEAAAEFRYEDAANLRDRVQALDTLLEKSVVVLPDSADADVYGIIQDELSAAVQLFAVRHGRVRGVRGWVLDKEIDVAKGTLVQQILQDVYGEQNQRPAREIIVPTLPEDAEALAEVLSEIRGSKVQLRTAQRGPKAELLRTAGINAMEALKQYKLRRTADFVARTDALNDLRDALGMTEAPLRIECYDVSHLQGTGIVASMVVFDDGLPKKRDYRRFNIADSRDDTDSIYQTLMRRLARLDEEEEVLEDTQEAIETADTPVVQTRKFAYRPQLLLIDGGQPQVAAAARALRDSGVRDQISIVGIAKRLEELWLPDDPYPVILPRSSEALFLVQRIRDEAHRFAIQAQRKSRKTDIRTQLGEIPGIGPSRTKALLRHFGSVKRLREATAEEIMAVPGIGLETAKVIVRTIEKKSD